jgi:hypothetical protein
MTIPALSYAEIVSSLALIISIIALVWNIIKHFIEDRVSVQLNVAFGEVGNIHNSGTVLFADAGSLIPTHKFDNPGMIVQIINTGRKTIGAASVGGKLKSGDGISMAVDGLPKMLQPYEIFSTTTYEISTLLEKIKNDELCELWVKDTQGKKWALSEKGWKRLRKTAAYIISNKHG